jgi:hypothetical protein
VSPFRPAIRCVSARAASSSLATHYSPPTTHFLRPLFSYSYELLFPQLLSFHNHPHCPGVWGMFPFGSSRVTGHESRVFMSLPPLCRLQKSQLLCNQANPASFSKMLGCGGGHPERNYGRPGVGVPRKNRLVKSATYSLFFPDLFIIWLTLRLPRLALPTTHCPLFTFLLPFVFITIQIPFPATPLFSHPCKTLGGAGCSAPSHRRRLPSGHRWRRNDHR